MPSTLRADAQANHDRLLEVAALLFAQEGADTWTEDELARIGHASELYVSP